MTTTRGRAYKQLDVFSAISYKGNPLGVVVDSAGINENAMQLFTNWTNLSEVTFLLPPDNPQADYRVRIFCPGRELPFAGHPTLGSCHAWLEAGGIPKGRTIIQECGIGLVEIRRSEGRLYFRAPPLLKSGALPENDLGIIAQGLGIGRQEIINHAWCDNGPNWRAVMLSSADRVLSLKPNAAILAGLDIGVVGPRGKVGVMSAPAETDEALFEVRAFFPTLNGMTEDPVTGSLNAGIAQWLIGSGLAPEKYVASQGTALGRSGRVFVEKLDDAIWVGGHTVTCVEGSANL
jgi:PhzF family phenazine biosynthesis protein